jgi:hypothetical protein
LSLQFISPLLISQTARLLHISTAKVFIALTAIAALASALAVFWLLTLLIEDYRIAAVGVLVVLLASSASLVIEYLLRIDDSNNYLPFLRRYLPAAPFPILFLYCGLTWRMLTVVGKRAAACTRWARAPFLACWSFPTCIIGRSLWCGRVVWLESGYSLGLRIAGRRYRGSRFWLPA